MTPLYLQRSRPPLQAGPMPASSSHGQEGAGGQVAIIAEAPDVPCNGIYSTTNYFRKICSNKLSRFQSFSFKGRSWKYLEDVPIYQVHPNSLSDVEEEAKIASAQEKSLPPAEADREA